MPLPDSTERLQDEYPENREMIAPYSPALQRDLERYDSIETRLDEIANESYRQLDELAWALPDSMTDEIDGRFSLSLTRHPTRDRTVIYTPLERFVERFNDAFQEESYTDFRESLDDQVDDSFETYLSIWDRNHEGWDEVIWTWSRIADIDELAEERSELNAELDALEQDIRKRYEQVSSLL